MGYDVKCNQKEIKCTPGPTDYYTAKGENLFVKQSHNYLMQNGGLKKPETLSPKEELIVRYFGINEKRKSLSKSYNSASRKQFSYFKTY